MNRGDLFPGLSLTFPSMAAKFSVQVRHSLELWLRPAPGNIVCAFEM
ncbi:hypothetical protein LT85_4116 [Collimonas arenae]|uniref:Uncharacterized protein n=1 Tax=Collimonas arenae TaxID=279058 RepID=A0A0A1FI30_9BURK|nr:hypothetical protein LT85_4116 [Collimonas arenae]